MLKVEIDSYNIIVPLTIHDNILIMDKDNNQIITKVTFDMEVIESYYGFNPTNYIEVGKVLEHPTLHRMISKIEQGHHEAHTPINIQSLSLYLDQCLKYEVDANFAIAATSLKDWVLVECIEQYDKFLKLKRRGVNDSIIYLQYPSEVTIFSLWNSFNLSIANLNPFSKELLI